MNYIGERILFALRNRYERYIYNDTSHLDRIADPDIASEIIYNELSSEKPSMICRFGNTEFNTILNYLSIQSGKKNVFDLIKGKQDAWWWRKDILYNIQELSGFFPSSAEYVEKFCNELINEIDDIDILASWINKETVFENQLNKIPRIFLPYLEPYWSKNPWSRILEDKRVLVVHPFAKQIEYQYNNHRCDLFEDKSVLPSFQLETIPAVQSLGGENNGFKSWFDALDFMKEKIGSKNFDICLIGCGAYGMPLAHHVKKMGKKSVHLAGALQLLFGIKGSRWESPSYGVCEWGLPYGFYTNLINEYWKKPGEAGQPQNFKNVEGACYW